MHEISRGAPRALRSVGSRVAYEGTCQRQVELETANNKLTDLVAKLEQEPLCCEAEAAAVL